MPITLNGTTGISGVNGSAGTPALQGTDTNTGIFFGTDEVSIATGGSNRLIVDSSGRVGLGTSSPGFQLSLKAAANSTFLHAEDSTGVFRAIYGVDSDGGVLGAVVGALSNHNVIFRTNNVERARIDTSGRVGIGTTSPSTALQVVGTGRFGDGTNGTVSLTSSANQSFYDSLNNAATGFQPAAFRATVLQFLTDASSTPTERARIDSSGRLLVGTSTARSVGGGSRRFEIEEVSGTYGASIIRNVNDSQGALLSLGKSRGSAVLSNTVVSSGDTLGGFEFYGADGTTLIPGASLLAQVDGTPGANDMPGRLVFSTTADGASSPTQRMRITAGGDVLIHSGNNFGDTGVSISPGGSGYYSKTAGTGATSRLRFENANGQVGEISTSGSSTTYATSSDYRLKENVVPLTGAVDRLRQIPVHRFNFIADPETTVDGFIAHEAQAVVPECVVGQKDAVNEDGSIKPQAIDQSKLVPLLTAALQEALGRIETLEAEVAALKAS